MNKTLLITGLTMAIIAGGMTQTLAESGHGKGPSFEKFDTDGDGKITEAELSAHHEARFAKSDSDGNGSLSKGEAVARAAKRAAKYYDHMLEKHDEDGDGELSMAEMGKRHGGGMFGRLDKDGDGGISPEEFKAMKGKHGKHHGGSE